jgi:8-amino-3,8-dideoxy-alpha-D-manno-octulosonate transaminase
MDDLALNGGPKSVAETLPREWPGRLWIDEEERDMVVKALNKDAFAGGLADDLQEFYGCRHALPVNSGTAALYTATAALGIGPGMEVLVPGFAWIPTYACIVGRGAIPVLVEVGEDLNMDAEDIERKITPRTKALIVVHMCGAAADMDPIMDVARRHGLKVIEDCAQAATMKYRGRFVGLFGDVGCFSMQQNKHLTSFCGGYVLSNDDDLARAVNLWRDTGIERAMNVVDHRSKGEVMWGMGYGMNILARGMAQAQMRKADRIIGSMQRAQRRILAGIAGIEGVRPRPVADPDSDGGSFMITYWPDQSAAARAAEALVAEGVPQWTWHVQDYGCHVYYHIRPLVEKVPWVRGGGPCPWGCPHNKGSDYSYGKGTLPKSDALFAKAVLMAVPSKLTDDQCDRIAGAYRKVAAHVLGNAPVARADGREVAASK